MPLEEVVHQIIHLRYITRTALFRCQNMVPGHFLAQVLVLCIMEVLPRSSHFIKVIDVPAFKALVGVTPLPNQVQLGAHMPMVEVVAFIALYGGSRLIASRAGKFLWDYANSVDG